jgi:hypothetical protein
VKKGKNVEFVIDHGLFQSSVCTLEHAAQEINENKEDITLFLDLREELMTTCFGVFSPSWLDARIRTLFDDLHEIVLTYCRQAYYEYSLNTPNLRCKVAAECVEKEIHLYAYVSTPLTTREAPELYMKSKELPVRLWSKTDWSWDQIQNFSTSGKIAFITIEPQFLISHKHILKKIAIKNASLFQLINGVYDDASSSSSYFVVFFFVVFFFFFFFFFVVFFFFFFLVVFFLFFL